MRFFMQFTLATLGLLSSTSSWAHPLATDRATIKKQAGCYEVSFEFNETEQYTNQPAYISPPYKAEALEWIVIEEESDTTIMLQHLLMTPAGVIKHWRQDWVYQPTELMEYVGDRHWRTRALTPDESIGRWAQVVSQVDDSPRYGCAASWQHHNSSAAWTCQTWAPLPRREFTQRSDYNILDRGNHVVVNDSQWLHHEYNTKIAMPAQTPTAIAREIGVNTYKKTDDKKCQVAQEWWAPRQKVWAATRQVWAEVYAQHTDLKLRDKVNNRPLWMALFAKTEEAQSSQKPLSVEELKAQLHSTIAPYIE